MFDTNTLNWNSANDNSRSCPVCDAPFTGPTFKKFCSDKCRRKDAPERLCEHCEMPFKRRPSSKDAARFCSRECGILAKSNVHVDPFNVERVLADELQHIPATMAVCFRTIRCVCVECGSRFDASNRGVLTCSDGCRAAKAYRKVAAANDNKPTVSCKECLTLFTPSYGDTRRVFCSSKCSKRYVRRISRKRERALLRTIAVESVDPIKVFERDGWKCQLCGAKTPRKLRGTYDKRAPELDHIVPLSKGGEHGYRNTQCACRECNGAKGATPMGQTLLFG